MRSHGLALVLTAAIPASEARAQDAPSLEAADHCAGTDDCKKHGHCFSEGARCVARNEADCSASTTCRDHGLRCKLDRRIEKCVSQVGAHSFDASVSDSLRPDVRYDPHAEGPNPDVLLGFGVTFTILGVGSGLATGILFSSANTSHGRDGDAFMSAGWITLGAGFALLAGGIPMVVAGSRPRYYYAVTPGSLMFGGRF